MATSQWIKIGLVGRPHGLRGDFFVSGREEPLPTSYRNIAIGSDPGWGDKAAVLQIRHQNGQSVMRCSASTSRDSATGLCGRPIWVPREQIEVDEEQHFLWGDLIGRAVEDCDGLKLGHAFQVYNVGASDIMVVRDDQGKALEIAIAPPYFDTDGLSQAVSLGRVRLLVQATVFEDFWQDELRH